MSGYSIIDRRKNPKGKNLPNRQRFLERVKHKIKDKLKENLSKRSITSNDSEEISVDIDSVEEPSFSYDSASGNWHHVLPGNKEYIPGDLIPKPQQGGQGRGNRAGQGSGEDEFIFSVNRDEYLNIIFEDLELPDLVKRSEKAAINWQRRRSGNSKTGAASNLDLPRSLRNSLGRRIALAFPLDRRIQELENKLAETSNEEECEELKSQISELKRRRLTVAYIDPIDIRYKRYERVPVPNSQAVMFCLMDVSGSMSEGQKEIAKRFFLLLYLFLQRKYKKVSVVFIRHTDMAAEVTEDEFFYSTESGGTEISSGLALMQNIIRERFNPSNWNLYCVQASDGDNMTSDNQRVLSLMNELLPVFQYYVYNEVTNNHGDSPNFSYGDTAADLLEPLRNTHQNLEIIELGDESDVVPTFRQVFAKK